MPSNSGPVSLSDEGKKSVTDFLESAARQGVGDGLDYAKDLPGFIADDTPRTVPFAAAKGIARQACRNWARGNTPQNLPGFDSYWDGVCRPYLEDIGEAPATGSLAPPFAGGQCPDTYTVTVRGLSNTPATIGDSTRTGIGPVSGVCFGPVNQFGLTPIGVRFANGCVVSGQGRSTTRPANHGSFSVVSVVRANGQADNCGNPPARYTPAPIPPGLPPLPPTTPIDIPGVGPVNIGVDFNPDGTISITAPDVGVDVNVGDPSGEGEGGGVDPSGGAGDQTDPGLPGDSSDSGIGGDAEGEAPDGEELVGLLVQVLASPQDANVFANNASQPFRGVGYVRMGYPNRLGVDISGGTVISPQFFHAQQRGLTNWAVNANLGFNLRTTPYYRTITP